MGKDAPMIEIHRRAPKRGEHDRVGLVIQYRPPKGSKARSRSASFTVAGTRNPQRLLDVIGALLSREAKTGRSIEDLHRELCDGGAA